MEEKGQGHQTKIPLRAGELKEKAASKWRGGKKHRKRRGVRTLVCWIFYVFLKRMDFPSFQIPWMSCLQIICQLGFLLEFASSAGVSSNHASMQQMSQCQSAWDSPSQMPRT